MSLFVIESEDPVKAEPEDVEWMIQARIEELKGLY